MKHAQSAALFSPSQEQSAVSKFSPIDPIITKNYHSLW